MPPKKGSGRPAGPAGASIPGVKALLQSCLKAMSIEIERLSDDDDVAALRKVFDDALLRSSGLKRAVDVAGLPDWGEDTVCPSLEEKGMEAVSVAFYRNCFTMQERLATHFTDGVPNYEADPVIFGNAMKKAIPMVEVRLALARMTSIVATSNPGGKTVFLVRSPAEDFLIAVFVNRVCLWSTPDGPIPALDVAYMYAENRDSGNTAEKHPVVKMVDQLMQHAPGGAHVVETEFTTDGAKAMALVLERTASILGAKTCEAMKRAWSLPPFAARRMSATAVVPIKVLQASDIHKVERKGGRVCASCGQPLPKAAAQCNGCLEAYYCGSECQKAHWPEHKKTCSKATVVSFEAAVEVRHGHNPFGNTKAVPQGHVGTTVSMNGAAGPESAAFRDLHKAGKLPAMPASGFIVKVQAQGFSGLKIYLWAMRNSNETFLVNLTDLPDQDQGW